MTSTYQLKVTLCDIEPEIWRRIVVPGSLDLGRLHKIIQDAMGWENAHLHSFEVKGDQFGSPDAWDGDPDMKPEKQYTLEGLVAEKDQFTYTYDFGDDWVHEIVVEQVAPGEPAAPRCIAGAGACPPEDCGGIPGYEQLVAALANPKHKRRAELTEWAPPGWSPERFDLELADRRVAQHGTQPGRTRAASKKRPPRTSGSR